jgi:pheromone shutdown protein TraB
MYIGLIDWTDVIHTIAWQLLREGFVRLALIELLYPKALPHRETSEMISALHMARKKGIDVVYGDRPYLSTAARLLHRTASNRRWAFFQGMYR